MNSRLRRIAWAAQMVADEIIDATNSLRWPEWEVVLVICRVCILIAAVQIVLILDCRVRADSIVNMASTIVTGARAIICGDGLRNFQRVGFCACHSLRDDLDVCDCTSSCGCHCVGYLRLGKDYSASNVVHTSTYTWLVGFTVFPSQNIPCIQRMNQFDNRKNLLWNTAEIP